MTLVEWTDGHGIARQGTLYSISYSPQFSNQVAIVLMDNVFTTIYPGYGISELRAVGNASLDGVSGGGNSGDKYLEIESRGFGIFDNFRNK